MRPPKKPADREALLKELDEWIHRHARSWDGVKAKALKAYLEGEHIGDICKVLGVSRQAFWKWRHAVEQQGVKGLETKPKTGRPGRLTAEAREALRQAVNQKPSKSGFEHPEWHGNMAQRFVEERFGIRMQVRQAQYWLHRLKAERKPASRSNKGKKQDIISK